MPPSKKSHPDINRSNTLLLIIDIQDKLCKAMDPTWLIHIAARINLLATLADELKIPIMVTEQYPQGLGKTIEPIRKILEGKSYSEHSKTTFGCCEDDDFNKKLKKLGKDNVILVGMETHVCVYLTALGLMSQDYQPIIVNDAVISRDRFYYENGLDLMRQMGCIVSNTETILFQLMRESGFPTFKKISQLLKETLKR